MARRIVRGSVALALTSLVLAAGGWSWSEGRVSLAAPAAGQCSRAEANAAVVRLGLSDLAPTQPVFRVLCGSLTGPGSRTMVASVYGPENVGMLYWMVFRWVGGEWQLVLKRRQAAVLTAAGTDIRETVSVYREGDPRCCPSGGERSRLWHWNGSQLVAGSWRGAGAKSDQPTRFRSPSGNIECWMYDGTGDYGRGVGCTTKIPPKSVILSAAGRLRIRTVPYACGCDELRPAVLAYDKQMTVGRFRCVSEETGVTCTVTRTRRGFLISRDGVRPVGR